MYLSKVEIFGFKSFSQKTSIEFNEGITSIVGPNGCGKTNVVDAIRWCLGEQRSGVLRSDKMENVIFNGTSTKKPMGMAEVSITIQNTKGILPTDYTDVTITRRIFRSGESEYLLNKNLCRLKDITNLFMDTGIGANAYSVIELKMVETILSNKAEERRVLFEEAAGVNKYKLRRRLALKKLDEVKADLSRVNDIISEVEKKVNSLERQAKKSNKYTELTSKLRELELDLAEKEFAFINLKLNQLKSDRENFFNSKIQLDSQINKYEDEISLKRDELSKFENQLNQKRKEISKLSEQIHSLQNLISVQLERSKSLQQNKIRFANEIVEIEKELKNANYSIEKSVSTLTNLHNVIQDKQIQKNKLIEEYESVLINLNEKKNKLKSHSEVLIEKYRTINNLENQLKNLEKLYLDKKYQKGKLDNKIISITNTIAKTVGYIEELSNEREDTKRKINDAQLAYLQRQNEKSLLEKQLSDLKEKEISIRSNITALKEKVDFIQNLIDNLEGISKGSKALLKDKSWTKNNNSTILAHIGNTDDKYRFAIEAALKNLLNNIIVESTEDLLNGIKFLKEKKLGKVTFFIPSDYSLNKKNIFSLFKNLITKRQIKQIEKHHKFVAWAIDVVDAEEIWDKFFQLILSNVCIVEGIDTALEIYKKYNNFSFATLNGDIVSKDGLITAGSEPRLDDTIFGRKKLLENLKNQLPGFQQDLLIIRNQIEEKEAYLNNIDLGELSEKEKMLLNDLNAIEKQISQFEFERKKSNDEIDKIQNEIKEIAIECNNIDNQKKEILNLLNKNLSEKQSLENIQKQLESQLNEIQIKYDNIISDKNNLEIEIERILGEIRNNKNSIKRAEEFISKYSLNIGRKQEDIKNSEEELKNISDLLENENSKLEQYQQQINSLLNNLEEVENNYRDLKNLLGQKEIELKKLRNEREIIQEKIHQADIALKEYEIKKQAIVENVQENYSLQISLKEFDDITNFDFQSQHNEIHELKNKIKNLGPVNLLAYSEYEEEKQRYDFLIKQRNDLLESEKDVVKTIEGINQTAQRLFRETFEKIRENFIKIFRTLFEPGDEADLRIEDNADLLEAKIEIIAKPRGKRPTSIDLLSGGEKTLTAIALLFAIYLVKPSPFCILDEIDAPLDDANIDRFIRLLNEFKKETQFIIVTHNKRTMEAAETLYGVTMEEDGISKLVPVKFNGDFDFTKN